MFGGTGGEELQSGGRVLDDTTIERATVFQLDFGVLETVSDDFVRVNDIVQERIERAAAHAGEVGTDVRAFAVKLVADEAGAFGDFVARLDVRLAVQHHFALLGNEFELVLARGAITSENAIGVVNHGVV